MPFLERLSDTTGLLVRKRVRDDQNSAVWFTRLKELTCQTDKIVAVAGDQNPSLRRGIAQLDIVRKVDPAPVQLMHTHYVKTRHAGGWRGTRIDVLVQ